jgi:hypothetical protein
MIQIINEANHLKIVEDGETTYLYKDGVTIKPTPQVTNNGIGIFHYGNLVFSITDLSLVTAPTFTDEADLVAQIYGFVQNNSLTSILDKDNGTFDSFYRQRFSTPETIFDSKQIADKQPLFWDDALVSGSGGASTYNANQASTTLSVANLTAGKRVRQTFRHFNYQPGKSQLFVMTGIFGASETGITKRSGLFNDNNGIFFQQSSTGFAVCLRTFTSGSAVNTIVNQTNWNIDKFDGTGASGITLDFTKTLIWFADFEWLGVGTIRYGFFVNGRPYYCHSINNSNINTLVYMSTPNLPLRYEIENDGTGGVSSFTHICSTVITEGGRSDTGYPFALNRKSNTLTTLNNTADYPLIAIRLNSGYLGAFLKLLQVKVSCNSTAQYSVELVVNPTIVGTALSYSTLANSGVDFAYGTNATTITGGTVIFSDTAQETNNYLGGSTFILDSDFALGSSIAGVSDIVVLAVSRITGTTETFTGALNFKTTL